MHSFSSHCYMYMYIHCMCSLLQNSTPTNDPSIHLTLDSNHPSGNGAGFETTLAHAHFVNTMNVHVYIIISVSTSISCFYWFLTFEHFTFSNWWLRETPCTAPSARLWCRRKMAVTGSGAACARPRSAGPPNRLAGVQWWDYVSNFCPMLQLNITV